MNCLQNYIGINYPGAPVPDSGLYVNQLPGVSLKGIDKVANEEQITFTGVWSDVQQRSLKKFSTAIINYFSKRYQLRRIHESFRLPTIFLNETNQQTPASPGYRGFTFDLGYHASPLAKIHIENLSLYLLSPQASVTFNVWEVVDEFNANLIDTLTLTNAVAGWNTLKVNKDYCVWKIFVGYESSNIESVWLPLNEAYDMFNSEEYMTWPFYSPCEAWIYGAQSQNPYSNLQEMNNLYGLSAEISTHCSFEPLICAQKALFATALWYQHGAELMTERIYSDRLNKYTTIDLKRAQDLQQYFQQTANTELAAVLDGINMVSWDCCIDCNDQVQMVHALP
jgi:hypothetical protein